MKQAIFPVVFIIILISGCAKPVAKLDLASESDFKRSFFIWIYFWSGEIVDW